MDSLGDIWNHIYLKILDITAHCDYDFVRYISALTYLFKTEMQ